jgi:iron complex outermembrane receptor protein
MTLKSGIILCVIFLDVIFVSAQNITDTTFTLQQVEINAEKPLAEKGVIKTSIDSVIIRESLDASLSVLLSKHSPVFIKTYGQGALATASFRGTAASHTQVEWNGMNINSPMLGQVDFSMIPVYFIDELELFHGGSSLQNGSGALGGSVLVNSKPAWDTSLSATFIQTIASFDTYESFIKVRGGTDRFFFDFRAYHEQSENDFRFYNNATGLENYEKQRNADYSKNGAMLNSWYRPNNRNLFSLHLWGQLAKRNLPPIMSYQGSGRDEQQQDTEFRIAGKWKNYGKNYKSEFSSGFTKTRLDYYLANETPLGLFINYDSESQIKSFYNKYKFDYSFSSKTILTASLNYNHHEANIFDKKALSGYDATRNETGVSLNLHHEFSKSFAAFCLVRLDYVDKEFTPLMPSAGFEYQVFRKLPLSLTANFTRNYHQPTLNDLYWLPGGNPDLKPEQGYTGDIALEYTISKDSSLYLNTGIGGYLSHISDWIIWRPGEFRYWQAENIKQVYARGIEYTLAAKGTVNKLGWGVFGNFAYTKTTNETESLSGDNSAGKQLMYIPLFKANLMTELSHRNFIFNYSIAFTGERYTTSSNENTRHSLPAYTLHDVSLGKKVMLNKWEAEIQFKVDNLFNIDYQAILWRAMPGRNYKVLIRLHL